MESDSEAAASSQDILYHRRVVTEKARPDTSSEDSKAPEPLQAKPSDTAAKPRTVNPAAATSSWRRTFVSLENRSFLFLWLGMLFMFGATQMNLVARSFLVWEMTRSATIIGVVSAGSGVPLLGLVLFGGAMADRLNRKRLIQAGQGATAIATLFIAVSIATATVTWFHLLGAALFQGSVFAFLSPARQAIIPQIVGRRRLTNALALNSVCLGSTTLAAPAIGGLLYAVIGPQGVYYVISAMLLMAVVFTSLITRLPAAPHRSRSPVLSEIKAGLSYVSRDKLVMVLVAVALGSLILAAPLRFLLPVFVDEVYHRDSGAYGVLISMIGLGFLMSSLAVASLGRWRRGLLLILSSFASATALLLVAWVPVYFAVLGIMVMFGLGDAGRKVLNQALLMEQVENEYQGRVMSVYLMTFGLMPLGVLAAGLSIDLLGGQATMGIMGIVLLVASALVLVTQKRLRDIQ